MHGALRMLFLKLDDNNDHFIDANELAWVTSTLFMTGRLYPVLS